MNPVRRFLIVGAGALVALLTAGSFAWACSPSGNVSVDPDSGAAGSTVTVSGGGFETPTAADEVPIEIRWNSTSGRVLGGAVGPDFSVSVTIPSNASGRTHYIVAVQRKSDGSITRQATAPFTVTTTAPAEASQPPAENSQPATEEQAGDPAPSSGGSEQAPSEPAPSSASTATTSNPEPSEEAGAQPGPVREAPAPRTRSAAAPHSTSVGAAAVPAVASTSAEVDLGDGVAETVTAPPAEDPVVSSVAGDVWSGFADGSFSNRGPSLLDPAPESSASSSRPAVVVGLVMLTSITLMASVLWSLRTSRRVLVRRGG